MAAGGELAQHIEEDGHPGGIIGCAGINFAIPFSQVIIMSGDEDNFIGQSWIGARKDTDHILPVTKRLLEVFFARPWTKAGSAEASGNVFACRPRTLGTGSAAFELRTGQKPDVAAEILPRIRLRYRNATDQ